MSKKTLSDLYHKAHQRYFRERRKLAGGSYRPERECYAGYRAWLDGYRAGRRAAVGKSGD